jgi:hypothetical protein
VRDRRVRRQPGANDSGMTRRWVLVIALICAGWLAAMVVASVLGFENKTPVRIHNWQPDRTGR